MMVDASIGLKSSVRFIIFLTKVLLVGFYPLLVGFNCGLHDDEQFIMIVLHIVAPFWHIEY